MPPAVRRRLGFGAPAQLACSARQRTENADTQPQYACCTKKRSNGISQRPRGDSTDDYGSASCVSIMCSLTSGGKNGRAPDAASIVSEICVRYKWRFECFRRRFGNAYSTSQTKACGI